MKIVLISLFLLTFSISLSAQECFQWKNLKLESSTLEETINILGKPKRNKIEKPKFADSPLEDVGGLVNFRRLRYKNIDDYRRIELLFLNGKLFGIEFTPEKKKLSPADLSRNFNLEFLYAGDSSKRLKFSDYYGQILSKAPEIYPASYFLLRTRQFCSAVATIDNKSRKGTARDGIETTAAEVFPGSVKTIQIFTNNFKIK